MKKEIEDYLREISNRNSVNEISDEVQHEISAAIHASARQSIRPYNTQNEYLFAMKEDLSEWLAILHSETINEYSFFRKLETGILLCRHANTVTLHAEEFRISNSGHPILNQLKVPEKRVRFNEGQHVRSESFFARDNVAQFIDWCRVELGISDTIMFETEDLVLRKNEKNFILTLLEVARRGAKFGMEAPKLVKMEQEIELEMMLDSGQVVPAEVEESMGKQKVAADFQSLDEMVQYYLGLCTCPTMFLLRKISEGKYQVGNSKSLIYMRILRNHVMVRVGGGWDALENYLNKHDPCRCTRHRVERHQHQKFNSTKLNKNLSPNPVKRIENTRSKSLGRNSLSKSTPQLSVETSTPSRRSEQNCPQTPTLPLTKTIHNAQVEAKGHSLESTPLSHNKHVVQSRKTGGKITPNSTRSEVDGKPRPRTATNLRTATKFKSTDNLHTASELSKPNIFDRLYASRPMRRPREDSYQSQNENLTVERKKSGHVISGRSSPSPHVIRNRRRTTSNEFSKTLSPSFEQRRSRPLKSADDSTNYNRRSQTPCREFGRQSLSPAKVLTSSTNKKKSTDSCTPKYKNRADRASNAISVDEAQKYLNVPKSAGQITTEKESNYSSSNKSRQRNNLAINDLPLKISMNDLQNCNVNTEEAFSALADAISTPKRSNMTPRPEQRDGFSRSRIPVPVRRDRTISRGSNPNYSPDRADSGIDIYPEFETSPTSSMRRSPLHTFQRPAELPE